MHAIVRVLQLSARGRAATLRATDRQPCGLACVAGDFRRQRFGQLLDLMPLADSVTQLASKCAFCSDK